MPFTVTMPKLSPTMESGVIAKWHKKVGDKVEAGDVIMEVSTDKATVEHTALDEGFLRKILVQDGGDAAVNQPIAIFTETKDESIEGYAPEGEQKVEEKAAPKEEKIVKAEPVSSGERIIASPLAKKIASQKGIDLQGIQGTGPRGRIVSKDLEKTSQSPVTSPVSMALSGSFEEVPLTPIRKVISQRLQEAKSTIPHFYVTQLVDAAQLVHLRDQLAALDVKVSFNDFVIKAVALALREHPGINSGFNPTKQSVMLYKTIDISIAVSLESGLITPIVKNADHKTLTDISSEVRSLATKAKEGKLAPHEFQGGSFTISNMGMFGVTEFKAIINPPQSAILAVAGIQDVAFVKNGAVVAGKGMNITLSVDHRVIDGVAAAKFIKSVQKYLENPIAFLV